MKAIKLIPILYIYKKFLGWKLPLGLLGDVVYVKPPA